jgi:hypothetical protein
MGANSCESGTLEQQRKSAWRDEKHVVTVVGGARCEAGGTAMLYDKPPLRKITVLRAPCVDAREALEVLTEAIPDDPGRARAKRVGGRIVAEVPTNLPSVVIKRRLADAGMEAEVDTIVRFVNR